MRIVHIAWLGERNFGDDLMAAAVRQHLDARSGRNDYRIWCESRPDEGARMRWIYPFRSSGIIDRFWERKALASADLLVVGGGSVLHSARSSRWKMEAVRMFKRLHPERRAVGLGLSVGPFKEPEDEWACAEFLRSLDACAFRDEQSHAFAQSLNLPYPPIRAFDLAATYLRQEGIAPRPTPTGIETVGLSVRLPYGTAPQATFEKYVELTRELAARFPRVRIFSFTGRGSQDDSAYCARIAREARGANVELIAYDGNLRAFVEAMKDCDFFVSTKLHGIIVPYLLGVPFISLSYQRKFEDFADDIGLPRRYRFTQADFVPSEVAARVEPYELPRADDAIAAAARNFEVFETIKTP